jgi:hypothetical protein
MSVPALLSGQLVPGEPALRKEDLHASARDPALGTMNFLNEITVQYPAAISFAPGRPYGGFFETEQIFAGIRRYIGHLTEEGKTIVTDGAGRWTLLAGANQDKEDADGEHLAAQPGRGCRRAPRVRRGALTAQRKDSDILRQ